MSAHNDTQPVIEVAVTGNDICAAAWADFERYCREHADELDEVSVLDAISRYSAYRAISPSEPQS